MAKRSSERLQSLLPSDKDAREFMLDTTGIDTDSLEGDNRRVTLDRAKAGLMRTRFHDTTDIDRIATRRLRDNS